MRDPSDSSVTLRCVSPSQGPQYSTVKIHRQPMIFLARDTVHMVWARIGWQMAIVALDGEGG